MVNQPSYNPNDRTQLDLEKQRNLAITDYFEPGSSIKPLLISAAIESGEYKPASLVDTNPGYIQVDWKTIKDPKNLGRIDLATVLSESSNVGASKIALSLEPADLWRVLRGFGLGRPSASGFPGESAGKLDHYDNWPRITLATMGYGYGLAVTPLQLAQAYSVIGAGGLRWPVSLLRVIQPTIPRRVISEQTAGAVLAMMEHVVTEGTGSRAAVPGYRVAGKTGTTRKSSKGGYSDDRYTAIFAGIAPVSDPRLAVVVVIDEPSAGRYYGGEVAAPVFARIVSDAVRVLAIPPDDIEGNGATMLAVASGR
jgi:cell division protein FtsI (penicillin-binding protein 3)